MEFLVNLNPFTGSGFKGSLPVKRTFFGCIIILIVIIIIIVLSKIKITIKSMKLGMLSYPLSSDPVKDPGFGGKPLNP